MNIIDRLQQLIKYIFEWFFYFIFFVIDDNLYKFHVVKLIIFLASL